MGSIAPRIRPQNEVSILTHFTNVNLALSTSTEGGWAYTKHQAGHVLTLLYLFRLSIYSIELGFDSFVVYK